MVSPEDIHGILVTLFVDGVQSLFVMLSSDGAISRMGTGAVNNGDMDLFIGEVGPELFRQLRDGIAPELLGWCGHCMADPDPQGKVCELTLGFRRLDGREMISEWRYGSQSSGPPPEVRQFVVAVVEATNPWFEQQPLKG
jgi:hypothetical protein